jgi:hypothetical protein
VLGFEACRAEARLPVSWSAMGMTVGSDQRGI